MSKVFEIVGFIVFSIALLFYRLFVLGKIWGYIAVKMFGLPVMSMWQIFAINWLLSAFTSEGNDIPDTAKGKAERIVKEFIGLSLSLLISYLVFG